MERRRGKDTKGRSQMRASKVGKVAGGGVGCVVTESAEDAELAGGFNIGRCYGGV